MCHMYGPEPKAAFIPTKEDQDKATESMRKFYAPQGEAARRLARYDDAVSLLRECTVVNTDEWAAVLTRKVRAFLAAEGKVAG